MKVLLHSSTLVSVQNSYLPGVLQTLAYNNNNKPSILRET